MHRHKRLGPVPRRIVRPEPVHRHQRRRLLRNQQPVIIALRPLLRPLRLPEHPLSLLRHRLPPRQHFHRLLLAESPPALRIHLRSRHVRQLHRSTPVRQLRQRILPLHRTLHLLQHFLLLQCPQRLSPRRPKPIRRPIVHPAPRRRPRHRRLVHRHLRPVIIQRHGPLLPVFHAIRSPAPKPTAEHALVRLPELRTATHGRNPAPRQRPPVQCRLKQERLPLRILRLHVQIILDHPHHHRPLRLNPPRQQDPLQGIQPAVLPRPQITRQIRPQQIVIHEGLVPLPSQKRLHHVLEKPRILPRQKEMQLVTRMQRIQPRLLLRLQIHPVQQKRKLHQLRIVRQAVEQPVRRPQMPHALPRRRQRVRKLERHILLQQRNPVLSAEMPLRIQPATQTQILQRQRLRRHRKIPHHRTVRIHRHNPHKLPVSQRRPVNRHVPILVRPQIVRHRPLHPQKRQIRIHRPSRRSILLRTRQISRRRGRHQTRLLRRHRRRLLPSLRHLPLRHRVRNRPRIQQQPRPRQQVARKMLRPPPLQHIPVFLTNRPRTLIKTRPPRIRHRHRLRQMILP